MKRYITWATVALLGIIAVCVVLVASVPYQTREYIYADAARVPTTSVAMVLGASVKQNGDLSEVLKQRADLGIVLYMSHKVQKILVTGDNGDLSHNEVNPVGNYMVARGIPKRDIFLDHAGFDTYSSMYRARDIFGIHDVTIVSQPFHLSRAVLIARRLGLTAYGAEAGNGEEFLYNTAREIPATLKALFDLTFSRVPKYLGQKYLIGGDGTATWDESSANSLKNPPIEAATSTL